MILAEMMAAMVEQERVPVQRSIPYGNTFVTFEALKQGRISTFIPEYNGTGLIYLGQPPTSDGDAAHGAVARSSTDLGLIWRDRFGFSNDYALTMRPNGRGVGRAHDQRPRQARRRHRFRDRRRLPRPPA